MGTSHQKRRRVEPIGPYAPARPHEADQREGLPMAVARDEGHTTEAQSPTTQSLDAFSEEVARRNVDPRIEHAGPGVTASREENERAEEPEGYARGEDGWLEMVLEEPARAER